MYYTLIYGNGITGNKPAVPLSGGTSCRDTKPGSSFSTAHESAEYWFKKCFKFLFNK